MSKNTTALAAPAEKPASPTPKATKKPDSSAAGFYCYIGPNLTGLIQNGAIFRGTRTEALKTAENAITKQPLVKTLIVSGAELPEARLKVKTPGNALYANYRRAAEKL